MTTILTTVRMYALLTLALGLVYPLAMTGLATRLFPFQAGGSLLRRNDRVVGSRLIGQNFVSDAYFWPRPSAQNFNPLPSGASNLGPTSADLKKQVAERQARLSAGFGKTAFDPASGVPAELLFASGSGLDPHISPEAAFAQANRVATSRTLAVDKIRDLVKAQITGREFKILGEPVVNVLELNLALDREALAAHE